MKRFLYFIFGLIFISGCSPKLSKLDTYFTPIPTTTKKLDIPKYGEGHQFKGYPYIYWNFCKQKQKQLGLECPETSIDSFIFRMWITNPVGRNHQPHGLIEIIRDSSKWKGKLILMHVNFKSGNLSETITDRKVIELKPLNTDWETIIDSLNKFHIDVLPTDDMIPNYYSDNSGYGKNATTFSFEYATKSTYRFFQYNNVYRVPDKFWQPEDVIKILNLLEQEFYWDSIARQYFR